MSTDLWYNKLLGSICLPAGADGPEAIGAIGGEDSLYILELFQLNFKQFSDGPFVLRLCFFDFAFRRFCGSQRAIECFCRNSAILLGASGCRFHFRALSAHSRMVVVVLELGHRDGKAICWTAVPVTDLAQITADSVPALDNGQLRQSFPLFAGSCRPLLLGDSLAQLQPQLQRVDAVLVASLRLSASASPPPYHLPEFHLQPGPPPPPSGSLLSDADDSDSFTALLDNLTLSYGVHADLSDATILDLLSREYCYGLNRPFGKGPSRLDVLERRLRIGVHNGLGFVEEPLCVLLQPVGGPSHGDPFRRRSHSLNRRDGGGPGTNRGSSSSEFGIRNNARLRHLRSGDPELSITFLLEYLIGTRHEGTDILSDARLIRIGWAAWSPCAQGELSLADTVTLQIVGGPRASPWDGLFLQDLSQSGLVRAPPPSALGGLPIRWPLSRASIELRFNFVPITEGDHRTPLALLSSSHQQTPLPRPDVRSPPSPESPPIRSPPIADQKAHEPEITDLVEEPLLSPLIRSSSDRVIQRQHQQFPIVGQTFVHQQQNAIEVEVPPSRVSAFPRRVIQHLAPFKFPQLAADQLRPIDPAAKREIRLELERLDKSEANEVAIQFMAFQRIGGGTAMAPPPPLFFTFQFFRFDAITTESLFADPESADRDHQEGPLVLCRQNATDSAPGLTIRFTIGHERRMDLANYLLDECLQVHVWEADSLFHLGIASVPLRCLLRQGSSPGLLASIQVPVLQSGFPPSLHRNCPSGLLYLRLANSALSVPSLTKSPSRHRRSSNLLMGEKAQSLRATDGKTPLERFLAFQRLDLDQRSMRIFGTDEQERMHQWSQLRGQEPGQIGQIAAGATKFLFSEELAAYRALRREGKALALLRAVFSSVTTRLRTSTVGGQAIHVRVQVRNPFPEDCICAMEVNDARLSPIASREELRYVMNKGGGKPIGGSDAIFHQMDQQQQQGQSWTMALRGMEKVEIALKFDPGTAGEGWTDERTEEARAFLRRLPSGDPLAIVEMSIVIARPFLSHHFRWFADEGRKLIRTVPIDRRRKSVVGLRVSDPSVLCQLQNRPDGSQLIRIECIAGDPGHVRDFVVLLYADPYCSDLCRVYRVSVHAMGRVHAETVQGQQVRLPLTLSGSSPPPEGEMLRLFCNSSPAPPPVTVRLLPSPAFAVSAQALAQMYVQFRSSTLGRLHVLVNAVASSTSSLMGQWLLSVEVGEPNIVKAFEVVVPRDTDGPVQKRIPLDNPLGIPRLLRLSSSDDRVLSLPAPSPPPIPPNSSVPLPFTIHPPPTNDRPTIIRTLLFVEDAETGNQEGAYALKVRFE